MPMPLDPNVDLALQWVRRIAEERGVVAIDCQTPRTKRVPIGSSVSLLDPAKDIDEITFRFNLPED